MGQPIIRGIQSVGAVDIYYRYNGKKNNKRVLSVPSSFKLGTLNSAEIDTDTGIRLAGFRLDEEFLRANPQIASSIVVPILGGGGVAVTNNNRTGSLTLRSTKVSTPVTDTGTKLGSMSKEGGLGPIDDTNGDVFDAVFIAQLQQGQEGGGDSNGADICIKFSFAGQITLVQFEGCTVGSVDPLALAGNNVADYNVVWNYLNWRVSYNSTESSNFITQ